MTKFVSTSRASYFLVLLPGKLLPPEVYAADSTSLLGDSPRDTFSKSSSLTTLPFQLLTHFPIYYLQSSYHSLKYLSSFIVYSLMHPPRLYAAGGLEALVVLFTVGCIKCSTNLFLLNKSISLFYNRFSLLLLLLIFKGSTQFTRENSNTLA